MFQESQPPGRLIIKAGKLGFKGPWFHRHWGPCVSQWGLEILRGSWQCWLAFLLGQLLVLCQDSKNFLSPPYPCIQSSFLVDRICHSFNSYLTAIQPPSFFSFLLSSPPAFFFFFFFFDPRGQDWVFHPLFPGDFMDVGMWFTLHSILQKPNYILP